MNAQRRRFVTLGLHFRVSWGADAVTGRLRIGGSIFTLLLFICITQRQSSLEDIPLAAFEMGGVRFIAFASLMTIACSLPIMVIDVALGNPLSNEPLSVVG